HTSNRSCASTQTHDSGLRQRFALYFQRIEQACCGDNGSTMLVIMENGDFTPINKRLFNFKAFGCFNIFKVNATKTISNVGNGIDEVLLCSMGHFNIKGVPPSKTLE